MPNASLKHLAMPAGPLSRRAAWRPRVRKALDSLTAPAPVPDTRQRCNVIVQPNALILDAGRIGQCACKLHRSDTRFVHCAQRGESRTALKGADRALPGMIDHEPEFSFPSARIYQFPAGGRASCGRGCRKPTSMRLAVARAPLGQRLVSRSGDARRDGGAEAPLGSVVG